MTSPIGKQKKNDNNDNNDNDDNDAADDHNTLSGQRPSD